MQRRSLLIVADSLNGGLGAVARAHASWFSAQRWRTVLVAPPDGGVTPGQFEPLPLPSTARSVAGMKRAAAHLRVIRRAVRPDLVHCHGLRSFAAAILSGCRPFVTLHGAGTLSTDPVGYARLRLAAQAVIPRIAAGAISAAPGVRGWPFMPHASPRLGADGVLPFPPPDSCPLFVWVGVLDERKPGDEFVHAIAELARRRPVKGVVVGGGPGLQRLMEMGKARRAPVEFLGPSDPEQVLARAWALCLFSPHEAVTFAVQEAMWAGRPVVVSPLPGLQWLVGDTGEFAADVDQAVAALESLCDPDVAARRGAQAAERVRRLIHPCAPWPDVAALYEAHLGESSTSTSTGHNVEPES